MRQFDSISEAQIEDAFVGNLDLLAQYLRADRPLRLLARQLPLEGGDRRLDLLLTCGDRVVLAELKTTPFATKHLQQTLAYRSDLEKLQASGNLMRGEIDACLLVTAVNAVQINAAQARGVRVIEYSPLDVMIAYFQRMSSLSPFLRIKPKDYGTYSIGRTIRVLENMSQGATRKENIARNLNLGKDTVDHLLRGAEDFDLVRKRGGNWFLTDLGDKFVAASENDSAANDLSGRQIEIIKEFISKNPFYSPTVFGIYALIECAFLLARNSYPIEIRDLKDNFRMVSGKKSEWKDHVMDRRTRAFLRFAVELELLGRIGDRAIITPAGFRFILMMQLHKGIEMIEGLSFPGES